MSTFSSSSSKSSGSGLKLELELGNCLKLSLSANLFVSAGLCSIISTMVSPVPANRFVSMK
jgi:hypothetical protein